MKKGCLVGASGKLRRYMVQHALDRGYGGVGVCREQGMGKLNAFNGGITVVPGATNDRRCRVSPPGRNPYHGDVENGSGMSPRREMSRAGEERAETESDADWLLRARIEDFKDGGLVGTFVAKEEGSARNDFLPLPVQSEVVWRSPRSLT